MTKEPGAERWPLWLGASCTSVPLGAKFSLMWLPFRAALV